MELDGEGPVVGIIDALAGLVVGVDEAHLADRQAVGHHRVAVVQSVDVGQLEAGRAVGLSYSATMLKIVIPQSIKNILPTLGNEFIVLVKETSVTSFIAVTDLTKAFRAIGDANYEYIIPYLTLAVVYLVIVMLITFGIKQMERRLRRSDRV